MVHNGGKSAVLHVALEPVGCLKLRSVPQHQMGRTIPGSYRPLAQPANSKRKPIQKRSRLASD